MRASLVSIFGSTHVLSLCRFKVYSYIVPKNASYDDLESLFDTQQDPIIIYTFGWWERGATLKRLLGWFLGSYFMVAYSTKRHAYYHKHHYFTSIKKIIHHETLPNRGLVGIFIYIIFLCSFTTWFYMNLHESSSIHSHKLYMNVNDSVVAWI